MTGIFQKYTAAKLEFPLEKPGQSEQQKSKNSMGYHLK